MKEADIKKIREEFHSIAGKLHSITIQAGTTVAIMKRKNIDSMNVEELKEIVNKMLKKLSAAEAGAAEAGKSLNAIHGIIYGVLDINTNKPVK